MIEQMKIKDSVEVLGNEPFAVPVSVYSDDRGWSFMNLLQGKLSEEGQINYSYIYPGVVKAWHQHRMQTDFWICVSGNLKVGVYDDSKERGWKMIIGEMSPYMVVIPPFLWHGASVVGHRSSSLLYYVTRAFNTQNPDEERKPFDGIPGFDWGLECR